MRNQLRSGDGLQPACAALAAGGDHIGRGIDRTRAGAETGALSECALTAAGVKGYRLGRDCLQRGGHRRGMSQGKSDRASAEREALAICRQRGKSCVLRAAFNKQCGALAADGNFEGSGTSTDAREAQQKAIDECRKAGGTRRVLHIMLCSM